MKNNYEKIFAIKPEALKVWDKVEIFNIARKCWDYASFSDGKKGMVWKWPFLIKEVNDDSSWVNYLIHNEEFDFSRLFPHYAVCLWNEKKIETIEIWWKKYNKEDIKNLLKASKKLKPIS